MRLALRPLFGRQQPWAPAAVGASRLLGSPQRACLMSCTSGAVGAAAAAAAQRMPAPATASSRLSVDSWGAVSSISLPDTVPHLRPSASAAAEWANHDGRRVDDGRYRVFLEAAGAVVPPRRIFTDPLHLLAYGSDASFYRLLPKAVIKVHCEDEVVQLLRLSQQHAVPVTFRAAGTSLSGQAISDSILIKVSYTGRHWRGCSIKPDGSQVTADVGLLGGEVNKLLAAHAARHKLPEHRIGPDPASIDSAMIGGIVANNASGMCCGVAQNSFHTLQDMRIVLADGTVLDTADPGSCSSFLQSHAQLAAAVSQLAHEVQANKPLAARIREKYRIKNTVGYSLNALVDFPPDDPVTIIKHLMVGSEGTLGFISSVTYNTVREVAHKASAFVLFPSIAAACAAVQSLKASGVASAVELCDYASLRLAQSELVSLVAGLGQAREGAAALLVEVKADSPQALQERIGAAQAAMRGGAGVAFGGRQGDDSSSSPGVDAYPFRVDPKETKIFWDFRKGLIPIIGGSRSVGTAMLIEDVVCPVEHLADMTADLIDLFKELGYHDASAVGHALEGNLHLVFAQGFRTPGEVATFGVLMERMAHIVAVKYKGSLKGEHGTGRNMAPFVELEWGRAATDVMRRIKGAFDPCNLLNPGVILNEDPQAHMQFLKPSPPVSSQIDNCMECGYCEAFCPSRDVTITPRQRIQTAREITRLRGLPERSAEQEARLESMQRVWQYDGDSTCAADGMCAVRCPVNINTGEYVKQLRTAAVDGHNGDAGSMSGSTSGGWGSRLALFGARHFGFINSSVPLLLNAVDLCHGLLGPRVLEAVSGSLNRITNRWVPVWNPYVPKGPPRAVAGRQPAGSPASELPTPAARATASGVPRQVVFLPTCVNRMMGPARGDARYNGSSQDVFTRLAAKAGYQVIVPEGVERLCCGMMFGSRGAKQAAALKCAEAITALSLASQMGKLPIVIDNSPCYAELKAAGLNQQELKFSLYEPVAFASLFLAPALQLTRVPGNRHVMLHVPCTSKQVPGLTEKFVALAERCADKVSLTGIPCCGMAGDRGLRFPELTASACQHLELGGATDGYSTSRTCEIGVSNAAAAAAARARSQQSRDGDSNSSSNSNSSSSSSSSKEPVFFRSILFLLDEASSRRRGVDMAVGELPQQSVGQAGSRPSLSNVHEQVGGAQASR